MIEIKKILVGTDFSPHSQVALGYAAAFAKRFAADVVVCHVLERPELFAQMPALTEGGYFPPDFSEILEKQARIHCEESLAQAGLSQARVLLLNGSPSTEIVRVATEEQSDLIIVGTHGHSGLMHVLIGSVAERVVRQAPCPVLTVRYGEHEFVTADKPPE